MSSGSQPFVAAKIPPLVSFGPYTLDLTRGALLRGSDEIKLRPKSYETLKYLVLNGGRLVPKSELIAALWPDAVSVSDDSLMHCIRDVRRALGDDGQEFIRTVPGRGYMFAAPVEVAPVQHLPLPDEQQRDQTAPAPPKRFAVLAKTSNRVAVLVVAVVAVAAVGLGFRALRRTSPPMPFNVEALTAYPGVEWSPALSRDGNLVAFSWTGPQDGPSDIWVKAVKAESLRRLTDTPAHEYSAAWSPDGQEIAFVRYHEGVFIVSQLGGTERKVSDTGLRVGWAASNKSVLIRDRAGETPSAIWQVDLDTLRKQRMTEPPSGFDDMDFSVSPDGSTLAFIRARQGFDGIGDVYVMPMAGGKPKRLTDWNEYHGSLAWTPDGREVIFGVRQQLWRIPASAPSPGKGTPVRFSSPSIVIWGPTLSKPSMGQPARMVFEAGVLDVSLRLVDLHAPLSQGVFSSVRPIAEATRPDWPGRFSPDGTKVAFASHRTGNGQASLWTIGVDDTQLRRLTTVDSARINVGSWSPDGTEIAFDAAVGGNFDLYAVREDGTRLRRVAAEASMDRQPWWSRDGRGIYFASDRSGRYEIWRTPANDGEPRQLTRNGGYWPMESPDGQHIYYLDKPSTGTLGAPRRLMRMPAEGGEEEFVLDGVRGGVWTVTREGILFARFSRNIGDRTTISLLRFDSKEAVDIGNLPFWIATQWDLGRMAASADGRWLLTNVADRIDFDLMLIDNFW